MKITCPCCDGSGEIEEGSPVSLSPMQLRIYDIVRRSAYGITPTALVDRVYAGASDGGPLRAYHSVMVQVNRANKRLAKASVRIKSNTRGADCLLRLQRLSS